MKIRPYISKIEFIGGPEDGRVLDLDECPGLVSAEEAQVTGRVPLFLALDNVELLEEGDELELVILGYYVSSATVGSCAKFEWFPLP